jgi:thiol-disulfide isomerase/thioredoxin
MEVTPPVPPRPRWWQTVGRQIAVWVGSIAIVAIGFFAFQLLRPGPAVHVDASGKAPDFTLPDTSGAAVQLSSLRGKPVVLNFWATWCGPCRVELPSFAAFAQSHPEIPVLGIAVESGDAVRLAAAKRALGIPYPVLIADTQVVRDYAITSFPTTVILDADGRIRRSQTGIVFGWQLSLFTLGAPGR